MGSLAKFKNAFAIVFACIICFSSVICYAQEQENNIYLTEEYWLCADIPFVEIDKTSNGNSITGAYKDFSDSSTGTFALYIDFKESSIIDSNGVIRLSCYVYSQKENYFIGVDKDGVYQCDALQDKVTAQSRYTDGVGGGHFMAVFNFTDKKTVRYIDMFIHINDHRYKLTDQKLVVDLTPTTTTTTTNTSNKIKSANSNSSNTNTKTSSETTGKYTYTGVYGVVSNTSKSNSSATTQTTATTSVSNATITEQTTSNDLIDYINESKNTKMSTNAKLIIAAGVATSVIGIGVVVYSEIVKKREIKEKQVLAEKFAQTEAENIEDENA